MRRRTALIAIACLAAWPAAAAETPGTGTPAAPDAAAETAEPVPPEVTQVLAKMEAAGEKIKTLTARFDYELNQTLYEDIQKRQGRLVYRAPNLLRFEFTDRPQETFVFDGRVVYHVKPSTRQLILWEMRTPQEPPVEALTLGKTPFPLPFGQKQETVLKHFRPGRDAEAEQKDPKKRAVLALVPKKGTPLAQDYTRILLWVDTERWLPTRARLLDTSENITTVDFHHIEMNAEVKDDPFARPKVPDDWEVVEHRKADAENTP
jgi:outer membrane lipoprotein-sorting protein